MGHPGFWEGMFPIWGSGRDSIAYFQEGRWFWGTVHAGLAISDVFLVKAAVTGIAKGIGKGFLKGAVKSSADDVAVATGIRANRLASKATERALVRQFGGRTNVFMRTSRGARYIDNLSGGIAREAKLGRVSLTGRIRSQIVKDAELLRRHAVKGVEWHFYPSAKTGIGPTAPLRKALEDAGIGLVIH